jgi:periplasmic divalent cation tolerance protein
MAGPASEPIRVALTTLPSRAEAEALAAAAVAAGLAACAQVEGPVRSHYLWEGEARAEEEWRVTLKVAAEGEPALRAWALARHPYGTPQWVVLAADAADAYLGWVRSAARA